MRRSVGLLRLGLFAALASISLPVGASAQSLEDRESEYTVALTAYDAAAAARDRLQNQLYSVLDSLTEAREVGDRDRIDALEGRFRDIGVVLSSRDSRVNEAREAYEAARSALLAALDVRLDSLGVAAELTADPVRRDAIGDVIFDLQIQYAQVAAEELDATIPPPSMMAPAFRPEPRDTPATLRAKAEFLEGKAADFQREIDRVDQLIARYEEELRLQRFTGDARASSDRFGDRQVPVRGARGAGRLEQRIVADTTGVDLESLLPQDAIVRLQTARARYVQARDQTLQAAEALRAEARGDLRGVGER